MKNRPESAEENSIKKKRSSLQLTLEQLKGLQKEHLSLEKNELILCITSTVGKHFKDESLPAKKREAILDLAHLVLQAAVRWNDKDTVHKKNKKLKTLIKDIKLLKNDLEISSVRVFLHLFKAPELSVHTAANNLIKSVERFQKSLKKETPKIRLSGITLSEADPDLVEVKEEKLELKQPQGVPKPSKGQRGYT